MLRPIGYTCSTVSNWLVVALTVDILILLKLPTRAFQLSTVKRSYIVILVIVFMSIAFNSISMYEYFEVPITIDECNGKWAIPEEITRADGTVYTPMSHSKTYVIYSTASYILLVDVLPTAAMCVCNIFIMKALISKNKVKSIALKSVTSQAAALSKKLQDLRLMKMVAVMSALFILFNTPDIAFRLSWKVHTPIETANIAQPLTHLFSMLNIAANFFTYAFFNKTLFTRLSTQTLRQHRERHKTIKPDDKGPNQTIHN